MRNHDIVQAAQLFTRVLQGAPLETAIEGDPTTEVTPRVRAWLYGTCRHYFSLKEQLAKVCDRSLTKLQPEVLSILMLGAFQLVHSRAKPHAVVSESVEASKRMRKPKAAGLVNAVLRKIDPDYKPKTTSGRLNLPVWLNDRLSERFGEPRFEQLVKAANSRAPLCLRVNQSKISPEAFCGELQERGIAFDTLDQISMIRLREPQSVTTIPGYADGWFAVQDCNAQRAVHELEPQAGMRVLDACAAPGNKSFQLLEHKVDLLALDLNPARSAWAEAEGVRLGLPLTIHEANATAQSWWDGVPFDRILVDAPCSATGTMARHPDVKIARRPDQVPGLRNRQVHLLRNIWDTLAVGGLLVYCTCSLLPEENDQVIDEFVTRAADARPVAATLALDCGPPAERLDFGIQYFPDAFWGDGIYLAKLQKTGRQP